jgi:hypothetical protein
MFSWVKDTAVNKEEHHRFQFPVFYPPPKHQNAYPTYSTPFKLQTQRKRIHGHTGKPINKRASWNFVAAKAKPEGCWGMAKKPMHIQEAESGKRWAQAALRQGLNKVGPQG